MDSLPHMPNLLRSVNVPHLLADETDEDELATDEEDFADWCSLTETPEPDAVVPMQSPRLRRAPLRTRVGNEVSNLDQKIARAMLNKALVVIRRACERFLALRRERSTLVVGDVLPDDGSAASADSIQSPIMTAPWSLLHMATNALQHWHETARGLAKGLIDPDSVKDSFESFLGSIAEKPKPPVEPAGNRFNCRRGSISASPCRQIGRAHV